MGRFGRFSAGTRELLSIGDAARVLGVTHQTLRNWDKAGKLTSLRHPINGYRFYRLADVHAIVRELEIETPAAPPTDTAPESAQYLLDFQRLPPCHWSLAVALDPKHRPQSLKAPSSTVRRDWRKLPQEAHLLDEERHRYRRLTPGEVAVLQGFDPDVVKHARLSARQKIGALGDAVPPPLARVLIEAVDEHWSWTRRTSLEICAGIGGLAEGATHIGLEHLALIERSHVCGTLLKRGRPWPQDRVIINDLRETDLSAYTDSVGLLSGGPPCQPWSQAGLGRGQLDDRDLFGHLPALVAQLRPEVFLFENVPGLASPKHRRYLSSVVRRLQAPTTGLNYGVLVAVFNAADFGVPQIRRRLFVLGMRDASGAAVSRCLDSVYYRRSHKQPGSAGKLPNWRTVGDALTHMPDPGGWRQWIV